MRNDHPLVGWFDWVCAGARPSKADLDELIGKLLGPDSTIDETHLRRELLSVQREIASALNDGNAGRARSVGAESAAILSSSLGPLPSVDPLGGRTIKEIIAEVPR